MRASIPSAIATLAIAIVVVGVASSPETTSAATVSAKWGAPITVGGVRPQGSATVYVYTAGTGALGLRLTGLKPSTGYWVGLYAGTCSRLGARVVVLPSVTSTASGTVTRGLTFNRTLTTRVRTLLRGNLSVAIGSVKRCGTLARLALSPTPTPTPSPTPLATPTPTPMPTPTPYDPYPVPTPY